MRCSATGLILLLSLLGCGGGGADCCGPPPDPDPTPGLAASLVVLAGANQRGVVRSELPEAVVVRVTDAQSRPVPGQVVNWVVVAGGGSVFAGAAQTNRDGEARERWTLGTIAGEQAIEVRAVDATTGDPIVFSRITATADPGPAATLILNSTEHRMFVGEAVELSAFVSAVLDEDGNQIDGPEYRLNAHEPFVAEGTRLSATGETEDLVEILVGDARASVHVTALRNLTELAGGTGGFSCTGDQSGTIDSLPGVHITGETTRFAVDSVAYPGPNGSVASMWVTQETAYGLSTGDSLHLPTVRTVRHIGIQEVGYLVFSISPIRTELVNEAPVTYQGGHLCQGYRPLSSFEPLTITARK